MDIKKVALALFCTISLVGCTESRQQIDSSKNLDDSTNFSELVTKPTSESIPDNTVTTGKYNVYSSVVDDNINGSGNIWTVTNIAEADLVYFVLPNDTAAPIPNIVGQQLSFEYIDSFGNHSIIVTSRPVSGEATFFVSDGIYSPPAVIEIWVSSNNSDFQKIWSAE